MTDDNTDALKPCPFCGGEARGAVRVKPLEWIRAEYETAFIALAGGNTYRVKFYPDLHQWVYDGRRFEHHDMAKAAAQADFDRRALSAIEPAPVTVAEAARVLLDANMTPVRDEVAKHFDPKHRAGVLEVFREALRALAEEDAST